jgi:hypothetical protein
MMNLKGYARFRKRHNVNQDSQLLISRFIKSDFVYGIQYLE